MNAKELKDLMEQEGWSQKTLARKLEVSQATVSGWMSGSRIPKPLQKLITILKTFN